MRTQRACYADHCRCEIGPVRNEWCIELERFSEIESDRR